MEPLETIARFRSAYSDWCERAFSRAPGQSFAEPSRLEKVGLSPRSVLTLEDALDCKFPADCRPSLQQRRQGHCFSRRTSLCYGLRNQLRRCRPSASPNRQDSFQLAFLRMKGSLLYSTKSDKTQPELPIHALDEHHQVTKVICSSFSRFLEALTLMMERLDPLQPSFVDEALLGQLRELDPAGIGAAGVPFWSRSLARKAGGSR